MIEKIIEQLSKLTIADTLVLVKELEKKWGISAQDCMNKDNISPVTKKDNVKTSYNLYLESAGNKRIKIISIIRSMIGGSLKDAKGKVDAAPTSIKIFDKLEDAESSAKKLQNEGALVKVK